MSKKSNINIDVTLGDDNVPTKLEWASSDSPEGDTQRECKAMLLSLFDKEHLDTFKIDLWTSELQVVEMDRFMFQTIKALADTYYNATRNEKLANDFRKFVEYFGLETEIIPKDS